MKMKTLTIVLAVVAAVAAEAPLFGYSASQNEAPYGASGWRPQGAQFNLPQKQNLPPQSYGAPRNGGYAPPTSEEPSTSASEDFEPTELPKQKPKPAKLTATAEDKPNEKTYYVIVPQSEKLVLAQPLSNKIVYEVADAPKSAAYATVPRLAAVQEAPVTFARLQRLPFASANTLYYSQPILASPYIQTL